MAHARELLDAARGRCDGVYVVAPYRKPTVGARAARLAGFATLDLGGDRGDLLLDR